ncbi:DUF2911 domain-containing protein [Aquiflexum sp.]|uniref:DUF2911 domain-containing protein n=1 Tax=Aquiflexum sp. TaxID=1872584 RepID=UPI003594727D
MKNLKFYSIAVMALFFAATELTFAQLQLPNPSPGATVSQNVGFTKISIDYSSPGVKGREIFGNLLKHGETWRAGANAPTIIEFSTAVNIGGTNVRPGKYSLFITPQQSGDWTVHLNSKGNAVYAYMKDGKIDEEALLKDNAVSFKVKPVMANDSQERLSYAISAENNKVAKVTMAWDKVRLSFMVDTQVDQKMDGFKGAF